MSGGTALDSVKGLIVEKGRIDFAEFMETALYHPRCGYYTAAGEEGVSVWGPGGDYFTSLDVSPVFAVTVAKAIR